MHLYKTSALKNRNIYQKLIFLFLLTAAFHQANAQRKLVVPITNHDTVSSFFAVTANGTNLSTAQFKDVHYASLQQAGKVMITIKSKEEIKSYTISPLSKHIAGKLVNQNTIQFALDHPAYLVIRVNKERLFLFAEKLNKEVSGAKVVSILKYKADATGKTLNTTAIQQAINETAQKKQ